MPIYELWRHDLTFFKDVGGGDPRQVPDDTATVDLYWKGATVSANSSGTSGHVIAVYDPGTVSVDDTVIIVGQGTTGTVTAVTATTITVNWSASTTAALGSRLIVTVRNLGRSRPLAYSDSQGTVSLTSTVSADSNGNFQFYTRPRDVDIIATIDTVQQVLADQAGQGGVAPLVFDFGVEADGTTDDIAALNRIENYASLKGGLDIELPPGTIHIESLWTINADNVAVRGQRGSTVIEPGIAGTDGIWLGGADITLRDLSVNRAVAGSASNLVKVVVGSARVHLKNIGFAGGSIGIQDNGIDTRIENVWFTGGSWDRFIVLSTSTGCNVVNPVAQPSASWTTAGIDITNATASPRILFPSIRPSGGATGVGISVNGSPAPQDVVIVAPGFSPGQGANGIDIVDVNGFQLIGGSITNSLAAVDITAGTDIQLVAPRLDTSQNENVNIDGGSFISLLEVMSVDADQANVAGLQDHVNIAAGVDDVTINGLTARKEAASNPANYAVHIAGAGSQRIQVLGVRGTFGDLAGGWVFNNSDQQSLDISHNLMFQTGTDLTYTHTAAPSADSLAGGGLLGVKTVTTTTGTTSVTNVHTLLISAGAQSWTGFTGGTTGQTVKVINIGAAQQTFADANWLNDAGATHVLDQNDAVSYTFTGAAWVQTGPYMNNS